MADKRELRFIQFRNRMGEMSIYNKLLDDELYNKRSNQAVKFYLIGEHAGHIFRIREWFYDHFDWRF